VAGPSTRVPQARGIPIRLPRQLHHPQQGRRDTRAPNTLLREIEVLQHLDHGRGPQLVRLDRRVRRVVELGERDRDRDLRPAEDEAVGQGFRELAQEVGAVGRGRAEAGDRLVVGARAAADLDGVAALARGDAEGFGDDGLVDGGLTRVDGGGGGRGGEESEEGDGVHGGGEGW